MTSLLTGSLAFAGFVLAAETYRSYKEKEEAEGKHEEAKVETILKVEKNVMLAIISKCVCLSGGAEDY